MLSDSEKSFVAPVDIDVDQPRQRARKGVAVRTSEEEDEETLRKVRRRPRQKEKVAPVGIDDATQATLDYIGEHLDVKYNVVGNDGGRFHVDVILTNAGDREIPACCWSIYLYHMKYDQFPLYVFACTVAVRKLVSYRQTVLLYFKDSID